jgi:hypothetical protein
MHEFQELQRPAEANKQPQTAALPTKTRNLRIASLRRSSMIPALGKDHATPNIMIGSAWIMVQFLRWSMVFS